MNRPGSMEAVMNDRAEAAAYWVSRRRLGLMTAKDEGAFEAWMADADNAAAFDETNGIVDNTGAIAALAEVRKMREVALSLRPARPAFSPWSRRAAAAAAALVVAFGAGLIVADNITAAPESEVASTEPAAAVKRYATRVGERFDVRLEDGSVVALNTASVVEVAFTGARRDVRLLQGQALFTVAKNKDRPFIVTAANRQVTAVGTAFDVRVNRGRVDVVLVEGRVIVEPLRPEGLEKLVPALGRQTLDAGEALVAEPGERVSVAAADIDRVTSWRQGQVIFRDDTVAEAVAEMNRYASRQLVIEDPRIAELRISGVFATEREENFIAALKNFYPIEAEARSPRVTVLTWRSAASAAGAS